MPEKIALLTLGIKDIPEFAALQITVEGAPVPVVVTNSLFSKRLATAGLDPLAVLRLPAEAVQAAASAGEFYVGEAAHVRGTDDWLATIVLPLRTRFAGASSVLSVRVDLDRTRRFLEAHPFAKTGFVTIVDRAVAPGVRSGADRSRRCFAGGRSDGLLNGGTRTIAAGPYMRPDGEPMLGAYAFPRAFDWAILVEKRQRDAYLAIERMIDSLLRWIVVGLAVAGIGALALAFRISRPIVEIDRVAGEVAKGNFQARVTGCSLA